MQTRYQCEKRVDEALSKQGFESFYPVWLEARKWSDRTKVVEVPLFPGYTFVYMKAEPAQIVQILRIPGMVRFLTRGRELISVPNNELEAVRTLVMSNSAYEPGPFPVIGKRVRIRGGCLEGLEGILTGRSDQQEIVVSVGAIQRSLKVQLGNYQVECVA